MHKRDERDRICMKFSLFADGFVSDMKSSDLVADLRAEIAAWWEDKVGNVS